MKVIDRVAAGMQAGLMTAQSTGRAAAEKGIHIGADKAVLAGLESSKNALVSAATPGLSVLGGVGITAAVSAGLSQMEYEDKKRDMRKLYKQEIAAQLGKAENKVKDRDIDTLAKGNHTIAEQMNKARRQRNLNIGTIFAATLISIGVVALALPAIAAIPVVASSGVLAFLTKAVVAIAAYSLVKEPIQRMGDKAFGLDEKTTHERIEDMHNDHALGKAVSREQVFAVFVQANPELDTFIRSRYGKKFDDLAVADKLALTELIGSKLGVDAITSDINHGRVKATELAFAVEGKISGVLPQQGESPRHSVLMTIKRKLHDVGDAVTHPIEHQHQAAEKSFVQRVGRAPIATNMGHVQQLEESRAASALSQRGA